MSRSSRWLILQLHADAVRFLDYMAVGDDIALRIDDHTRTERTLTNVAAVSALTTEKAVKEILEAAALVIIAAALIILPALRRPDSPALLRTLDRGLRIDVHHTRLKLFRDL